MDSIGSMFKTRRTITVARAVSLGMGAYIDQFAKDVREATETVTNLSPAMDTIAEILGQEWETSLHDMLMDIDAVWHGGIEKALELELQERGKQ